MEHDSYQVAFDEPHYVLVNRNALQFCLWDRKLKQSIKVLLQHIGTRLRCGRCALAVPSQIFFNPSQSIADSKIFQPAKSFVQQIERLLQSHRC